MTTPTPIDVARARIEADKAQRERALTLPDDLAAQERYGLPGHFIDTTRAFLDRMIADARPGGEGLTGYGPEVEGRLVHIERLLSWSDDDLGGYHLGRGRSEADEAARRYRGWLGEQRERLLIARTLIARLGPS